MSSRTRPTRRRRADGLRARPLLDLFAEAGKNAAVAAEMIDDQLAGFERIEEGVDTCESAAHVLEGIAVKQS